jgi:hypothetical protein
MNKGGKWASDPSTGSRDFWEKDSRETRCKHPNRVECEECGTTIRRDVVHKTEGGRGTVGKLLAKKR